MGINLKKNKTNKTNRTKNLFYWTFEYDKKMIKLYKNFIKKKKNFSSQQIWSFIRNNIFSKNQLKHSWESCMQRYKKLTNIIKDMNSITWKEGFIYYNEYKKYSLQDIMIRNKHYNRCFQCLFPIIQEVKSAIESKRINNINYESLKDKNIFKNFTYLQLDKVFQHNSYLKSNDEKKNKLNDEEEEEISIDDDDILLEPICLLPKSISKKAQDSISSIEVSNVNINMLNCQLLYYDHLKEFHQNEKLCSLCSLFPRIFDFKL